jgi:hypothetical protein
MYAAAGLNLSSSFLSIPDTTRVSAASLSTVRAAALS